MIVTAFYQTLYMSLTALMIGALFALPLALFLYLIRPESPFARKKLYHCLNALINLSRSFPFAILLILLLPFTRLLIGTSIGTNASIVPLTLAAIPFMARLFQQAFLQILPTLMEALLLLGLHPLKIAQVLCKESLPALIEAMSNSFVVIVGYSTMAGLVGGGGLGQLAIQYGYQMFDPKIMAYTLVCLVAIVATSQHIGNLLSGYFFKRSALILLFFLSGCAKNEDHKLKIAASPSPHAQILEKARPHLLEAGIDLEILVIADYQIPNRALAEGQIDANYFQHLPFLERSQQELPTTLTPLVKLHIEPLGLYTKKGKQLSTHPLIAIPNDPSNRTRALEFLASLTFLEGSTLIEVDGPMLPRILDDVDGAVINANIAIQGGLCLSHALFLEKPDPRYTNLLVVRQDSLDDPRIQTLKEILSSERFQQELCLQNLPT